MAHYACDFIRSVLEASDKVAGKPSIDAIDGSDHWWQSQGAEPRNGKKIVNSPDGKSPQKSANQALRRMEGKQRAIGSMPSCDEMDMLAFDEAVSSVEDSMHGVFASALDEILCSGDAAVTMDGIVSGIKNFFGGGGKAPATAAPQTPNAAGGPVSASQQLTQSLADHDKKNHPGGYKGGRCTYRDKVAKVAQQMKIDPNKIGNLNGLSNILFGERKFYTGSNFSHQELQTPAFLDYKQKMAKIHAELEAAKQKANGDPEKIKAAEDAERNQYESARLEFFNAALASPKEASAANLMADMVAEGNSAAIEKAKELAENADGKLNEAQVVVAKEILGGIPADFSDSESEGAEASGSAETEEDAQNQPQEPQTTLQEEGQTPPEAEGGEGNVDQDGENDLPQSDVAEIDSLVDDYVKKYAAFSKLNKALKDNTVEHSPSEQEEAEKAWDICDEAYTKYSEKISQLAAKWAKSKIGELGDESSIARELERLDRQRKEAKDKYVSFSNEEIVDDTIENDLNKERLEAGAKLALAKYRALKEAYDGMKTGGAVTPEGGSGASESKEKDEQREQERLAELESLKNEHPEEAAALESMSKKFDDLNDSLNEEQKKEYFEKLNGDGEEFLQYLQDKLGFSKEETAWLKKMQDAYASAQEAGEESVNEGEMEENGADADGQSEILPEDNFAINEGRRKAQEAARTASEADKPTELLNEMNAFIRKKNGELTNNRELTREQRTEQLEQAIQSEYMDKVNEVDPCKNEDGTPESAEDHFLHCKANPRSNCPFLRGIKAMTPDSIVKMGQELDPFTEIDNPKIARGMKRLTDNLEAAKQKVAEAHAAYQGRTPENEDELYQKRAEAQKTYNDAKKALSDAQANPQSLVDAEEPAAPQTASSEGSEESLDATVQQTENNPSATRKNALARAPKKELRPGFSIPDLTRFNYTKTQPGSKWVDEDGVLWTYEGSPILSNGGRTHHFVSENGKKLNTALAPTLFSADEVAQYEKSETPQNAPQSAPAETPSPAPAPATEAPKPEEQASEAHAEDLPESLPPFKFALSDGREIKVNPEAENYINQARLDYANSASDEERMSAKARYDQAVAAYSEQLRNKERDGNYVLKHPESNGFFEGFKEAISGFLGRLSSGRSQSSSQRDPSMMEQAEQQTPVQEQASNGVEIPAQLQGGDIGVDHAALDEKISSVLSEDRNASNTMSEEAMQNARQNINKALSAYGVTGQITDVNHGPRTSTFTITTDDIASANKFLQASEDLKKVFGHGTNLDRLFNEVRVTIPNGNLPNVTFGSLFKSQEFKDASKKMKLPMILGRTPDGKPIIEDLADCKHMLVGGATGQGKSVCLNSILGSLFSSRDAGQINIGLIDPKQVEFSAYGGMPQTDGNVVTDKDAATDYLVKKYKEMNSVQRLLSKDGSKTIADYNKNHPDKPLKYNVVVIDECEDLFKGAKPELLDAVRKLTALGRNAGFHCIIATQKPTVEAIPGSIKSNLPVRVGFKTSSASDSRVILDENGAEQLLGKGDMMIRRENGELIRGQGANISDKERDDMMDIVKKANDTPEYELMRAGF